MSLRIRNPNESPPGYWRYRIPETGAMIGPQPSKRDLMNLVHKHYQANSRLEPGDLDEKVETYMCSLVPAEFCEDSNPVMRIPTLSSIVAGFFSVVQGTITIGDWWLQAKVQGRKLVDQDLANRRAEVCADKCFDIKNVPIGKCAACVFGKLGNAVVRAVERAATPYDDRLRACQVCGCGLKAKVHIPLDILRNHMSEDHLARFPEWCWMVTEAAIDTAKPES